MRKTARVVSAGFVLASASVGFVPLAHAATTQVVNPTTEAWFQPNPSCASPVGCLSAGTLPAQPPAQPPAEVPTTVFPAGTLHVGVDAGQETARSYLALSLPLGTDTLTGAVLDVPLDAAQASGSVTPENAKIVVCTFTGSISAASGSFDPPPAADCSRGVAATYVATPSPHLRADLGSMLASLSAGAGLALLPDATKIAQTDNWRAVFSARDRADAAKTAPASLTLTLEPAATPPAAPVAPPAAPPVQAPPPAIPTEPFTPVQEPAAPTIPTPQQPGFTPVPQARTVTVGYAYPTVWLLPLGFLILIPLVARALTRDLTPVPVEEPSQPRALDLT